MRKAKQGPALFELLDKERVETSGSLKVPTWWSAKRRITPTTEDGDVELRVVPLGESGSTGGEVETQAVLGPVRSDSLSAGDPADAAPLLEMVGGRVRVSLNSIAAAVVVFVLMVGALGVFEVGRRSGEKVAYRRGYESGRTSYAADAASEIEIARSQPPATHVVSELLVAAPSTGVADSTSGLSVVEAGAREWVRDYTYIVAQEFSADRSDDALIAQEFLAGHGVETAMVQLAGGAFQLITKQGYNHREPTQRQLAEELLARQHGIGEKYFATGGGYRLQGYFRTLKNDTW